MIVMAFMLALALGIGGYRAGTGYKDSALQPPQPSIEQPTPSQKPASPDDLPPKSGTNTGTSTKKGSLPSS